MGKAAVAGDDQATFNLGLVYYLAADTPELGVDSAKAKHYLEMLVQRGNPQGYLELGWVYSVLDHDVDQAAEAFEQAGRALRRDFAAQAPSCAARPGLPWRRSAAGWPC